MLPLLLMVYGAAATVSTAGATVGDGGAAISVRRDLQALHLPGKCTTMTEFQKWVTFMTPPVLRGGTPTVRSHRLPD
eukprot:COSAG01_NODE_67974_length_265_cov_0.939759_1_plen_76_part_01